MFAIDWMGGNNDYDKSQLAHNTMLLLGELLEFDLGELEVLREPIESGKITIFRAMNQTELVAQFQLVKAMNSYHSCVAEAPCWLPLIC